jgi:hypothetical protein
MTELSTDKPAKPIAAVSKKPWETPRVDKIDAGQAELFTRAAADGPFSSS